MYNRGGQEPQQPGELMPYMSIPKCLADESRCIGHRSTSPQKPKSPYAQPLSIRKAQPPKDLVTIPPGAPRGKSADMVLRGQPYVFENLAGFGKWAPRNITGDCDHRCRHKEGVLNPAKDKQFSGCDR